uniref:Uncharacterized protein n=1 Tax=Arundo donax TaxID=35708 RepID=A0A0A9GP72_ARUDO
MESRSRRVRCRLWERGWKLDLATPGPDLAVTLGGGREGVRGPDLADAGGEGDRGPDWPHLGRILQTSATSLPADLRPDPVGSPSPPATPSSTPPLTSCSVTVSSPTGLHTSFSKAAPCPQRCQIWFGPHLSISGGAGGRRGSIGPSGGRNASGCLERVPSSTCAVAAEAEVAVACSSRPATLGSTATTTVPPSARSSVCSMAEPSCQHSLYVCMQSKAAVELCVGGGYCSDGGYGPHRSLGDYMAPGPGRIEIF